MEFRDYYYYKDIDGFIYKNKKYATFEKLAKALIKDKIIKATKIKYYYIVDSRYGPLSTNWNRIFDDLEDSQIIEPYLDEGE